MKDNRLLSSDGASICYKVVGRGPGVIVVPGVLSDADDFKELAHALSTKFTVYILQRRGRAQSEPQAPDYSMKTEISDVMSLQKKTKAEYLFGHSYGGLIALELAVGSATFSKVAVYEPAVSINNSISVSWATEYKRYLKAGQPMEAFITFSLNAGPDKQQKTPRWVMRLVLPLVLKKQKRSKMFAMLDTNLNEHLEVAHMDDTYPKYSKISAKVLFMFGGKSGVRWVKDAVTVLSTVIPDIMLKEFPKLNHFGPDQGGPKDVADELINFFLTN